MSSPAQAPVAFVDSSALVALADRDDATHQPAVEAYRTLLNDGYCLFTTNHVVAETFGLLASRTGLDTARTWLSKMSLAVYIVDSQDEDRARQMLIGTGAPNPASYVDAVSYVVMERLGVTDAFAIDPDFLGGLS